MCGKVSFDFEDEIWIPYAKMLPTVRPRLVVEILEDLKCEFPYTFRRLYDALPSLLIQCEQNGDRELSGIRSLIGKTEALQGRSRAYIGSSVVRPERNPGSV
ncbi:MAG: hypothetical protein HYU64_06440 [Armatimonadetes bacterium]|nr:hypothetical protein [Armatimonadota bacterium]